MPKSLKILLIIFSIILIGFISLSLVGYHIITRSLPVTQGEIYLSSIDNKINIFRDNNNIPHIRSNNEFDLYFTQGFITSQDRLWQMDLIKRAANGNLSEIFTNYSLPYDTTILKLGFKRSAQRIKSQLCIKSKNAFKAYTAGINAYINKNNTKLPVEFKLLNYKPELWTIEDCIAIFQWYGWQMNSHLKNNIITGEVIEKTGLKKTLEIFPFLSIKYFSSLSDGSYTDLHKSLFPEIKSLLLPQFDFSANTFIIGSKKSTTGKPIHSFIPNLNLSIPCTFYELHLSSNEQNVYGLSLPGIPGIIAGYNQNISWSFTSSPFNSIIFRIMKYNSLYSNIDNKNGFRQYENNIRIKFDSTAVFKTYYCDNFPAVYFFRKARYGFKNAVIADWAGFEPHDSWLTFYKLNKAENWPDFLDAIKHNNIAPLDFFYADIRGNIGTHLSGKIRREKIHNLLFSSKPSKNTYIPFLELPGSYNPSRGSILQGASEPNNPYPSFKKHVSSNNWIIQRIDSLIFSSGKLSPGDIKSIHSDELSLFALEAVKNLLQIITIHDLIDKNEQQMLENLKKWQGSMNTGSAEAAFFQVFIFKLLQNSIMDELGTNLFNSVIKDHTLYSQAIINLLRNPLSSWFNNSNSDISAESGREIIIKTYKEAILFLVDKLGNSPSAWSWGALHKMKMQNIMCLNSLLKNSYETGPFPIGGSSAAINCFNTDFLHHFHVSAAPAARMIIDLNNLDNSVSVISTGESGQPFDIHYRDQVQLFLKNLYHSNLLDTSRLSDTGWNHLKLIPEIYHEQ